MTSQKILRVNSLAFDGELSLFLQQRPSGVCSAVLLMLVHYRTVGSVSSSCPDYGELVLGTGMNVRTDDDSVWAVCQAPRRSVLGWHRAQEPFGRRPQCIKWNIEIHLPRRKLGRIINGKRRPYIPKARLRRSSLLQCAALFPRNGSLCNAKEVSVASRLWNAQYGTRQKKEERAAISEI